MDIPDIMGSLRIPMFPIANLNHVAYATIVSADFVRLTATSTTLNRASSSNIGWMISTSRVNQSIVLLKNDNRVKILSPVLNDRKEDLVHRRPGIHE